MIIIGLAGDIEKQKNLYHKFMAQDPNIYWFVINADHAGLTPTEKYDILPPHRLYLQQKYYTPEIRIPFIKQNISDIKSQKGEIYNWYKNTSTATKTAIVVLGVRNYMESILCHHMFVFHEKNNIDDHLFAVDYNYIPHIWAVDDDYKSLYNLICKEMI